MKWWAILAATLLLAGSTATAQDGEVVEVEVATSVSELQLDDLTVTLREPEDAGKSPATLEISKAWKDIDEEKRKFVLGHLKEILPKGAMKSVLKALVEGKQKIVLPALKSCEDCEGGCSGKGGGCGGGKPCAGGGCGKNVTVRSAGRIALGGLVPPEVEEEIEEGESMVGPRMRLKIRTNDPDAKLSEEEQEQIRKALSGIVDSDNVKKILMVLDKSGHIYPWGDKWGVPHAYQSSTPLKFWWSSPHGGARGPCRGGCHKDDRSRGPCGCRKSECGSRPGACGCQKGAQSPRPGACGCQSGASNPRPAACGCGGQGGCGPRRQDGCSGGQGGPRKQDGCRCGGAPGHEGAILRALNTLTTEIAALRREIAGMRGAPFAFGVPMPKARPGGGTPVPPKAPVPPNFHVITEGGARKLNVTPHYRVQGVAPGQYRVAVAAPPAARQKEALQAEVKQVQDELKELRETMKKLAARLSEMSK